jgi:2,4-dienoyl-CoA reductase-like NADH-dependent reductase (Old Yellow Enzyme family)
MPPMVRGYPSMPREVAETGGRVTDAVVEHYRRRATAGTGMIIVEATAVDADGRAWPQGLRAYADEHIAGLARLASAMRAEGAVANIQLVHGGPQGSPSVTGRETVGPSAVAPSAGEPVPRPLTVDEIQTIEQRFAEAAARAAEAGFDAVEVHGAHGYLLDSFLLRQRNRRTDAYGGQMAGRMRFLLETCRHVRSLVGDRILLDCRVSFHNKRDEGFSQPELVELVQGLEGEGVDILHVSTDGAFREYFDTGKTIGKLVKEATDLPIIVAGGMRQPDEAERLIAEGHADLAAVGTAMLEDPDWSGTARAALEGGA